MIEKAKAWLDDHYEELIKDLTALIACPSVEAEAMPNMPFGKGVNDALMCVKGICEKFGFEFHNADGYIGYMDFEDRGTMPEYGILVHVDVVPPTGFTDDPYKLVRKDGKLIGRGAIDDKGPCVIMIYVLAALKAVGFSPKSNVRLMFGCNEETGWKCIEHAKKQRLIPKQGYSPDADYPLINEEKGIVETEFRKKIDCKSIKSICAGAAFNAVPGIAEAELNISADMAKALFESAGVEAEIKPTNDGCKVTVFGKAAHASIPYEGDNAALKLLSALKDENAELKLLLNSFSDLQGRGIDITNDELSLALSVLSLEQGILRAVIDIRYPNDIELRTIQRRFEKVFDGFEITVKNENPNHRVEKDNPLCRALLNAYESETGKRGEPICIGGGTYARAFETGVAFGCVFEDEPMLAHMADEYITEDSIKLNLKIQLAGVFGLCK